MNRPPQESVTTAQSPGNGKPRHGAIDDAGAAKILQDYVATGEAPAKAVVGRLAGCWPELLRFAREAEAKGESAGAGLVEGLGWLQSRDPGRHAEVAAALEAVGFGGGEGEDEPDEGGEVVDRWPALDPRAYRGIAGEFVEKIDPHSEADPAATLVQFLVAFGNLVGRGPHFVVTATRHYLNLFVALVGLTAVGRKGTSWDGCKFAFGVLDPSWPERVKGGLVSGEGLIHHVRDPKTEERDVRAGAHGRGPVIGRETVTTDPGAADKRLCVVETEMSRLLKAMNRDGNTLSDVIRQAWDGGDLDTMGKNAPSRATGAHVSLICHATQADVRKHLSGADGENGFANRFLWAAVRRSKFLPEGGDLYAVDWASFHRRLLGLVESARLCGRMRRDADARDLWASVYGELSAGKPGLVGAVLSRAEAQTMRLACLYALLDDSQVVRVDHLESALALWGYCEASARLVFGDAQGDPDAEKLAAAIKAAPEGLTRSEIVVKVFSRHAKADKVNRLLSEMLTQGLIRRAKDASKGGRPAERWRWGR